jgi:hypothetical protein
MTKPDDRPRRNGLPLFSKKRWEEGKRSTFNPPKKTGKSAEQKAYEETHQSCEVSDTLQRIAGEEWLAYCLRNVNASVLWNTYETHHVYRRQYGDDRWNLIRCLTGAHKFGHENPPLFRLACVLAKEAKGELEIEAALVRLNKNPLGLIANDLENGKFYGKAAAAAQRLCDKYGL